MQMRPIFFALLCLAFSGCPSDPAPADAGVAADAGPSDAGTADTGRQTIGNNPCGCTGIQICDPEFLDCIEPEECIEDEDCRTDRICVRGGCYDCWGDEMAACVGAQLCDRGACVSAGVCTEDYDCVDGLVCDDNRRCSPPEPCDADDLEPNDHPLQAKRIGGVRRDLWTCGNGDWYKVRQHKSALIVRVRGADAPFDPTNIPIVTIFDGAARRALATGAVEGDRIVAGVLGEPQGEDLLVHILSTEPLRYDIAIKHRDDFCPTIDAEPNHSPDMALGLTLGMELHGSLCAAGGDDEDTDLYSLQAVAGQRIGFMLEQGGADQVVLGLLDETGQPLGEPLTLTERHSRGLLGTIEQTGTIYVTLRGVGSAYRLRVGLFSPAGTCEDDAREPDDQADFAQRLGAEPIDGVLCPGSLDHLSFDAQGDDGLHLVVTETQGSGSSWMLRTPSGQGMSLRRNGNTLRLDRQRMGEPGRYLLVGVGGAERSTYRVELDLVAGGACTPDGRDPGDNAPEGASTLNLNQGSSILTACDDADWFRVTLPQGNARLTMRRFSSGEAPISLELFSAGADLPQASTLINGSEGELPLQLDAAGEYLVRVMGDAHESNRYQLMALGTPPTNDTCANPDAIRLSRGAPQEILGTTQGAHDNAESNCGGARAGDVQYFVQVPDGGGQVTFELETLASEQGYRSDHLLSLSRLCGESSEILCDDDNLGTYHDRLSADLEAGIYTLTVDSMSSFSGGSPFRLTAAVGAAEERLPLMAAGDGCGAGIPTIELPEGERGQVDIASTTEGLSDSARGSCGFTIEGRDAFFAFELSAPARVQAVVPYAGRSSLYLRAAACTLPVDLACSFTWRGNQNLALGTLPAGRYVLIYDRMSTLDGPFTLSLTLSDP